MAGRAAEVAVLFILECTGSASEESDDAVFQFQEFLVFRIPFGMVLGHDAHIRPDDQDECQGVDKGAWGEFYRAGYVTTKVYFRSKNPPKLTQNNDKNYCYLPIFRDVYVPKASLKKYKKWYKKNDALQFARIKTF